MTNKYDIISVYLDETDRGGIKDQNLTMNGGSYPKIYYRRDCKAT